MALTAETVASVPLDVRWNTPIHDPTRIPADPPEPAVIHYHQELDRLGQIRATGAPSIDRQIDVANTAIRKVWTKAAPESSYREWLSHSAPEQDHELMRIVDVLINALEPSSVLDVGANSGVGRNPTIQRYTTIAPSDDVQQTLAEQLFQADLVVCVDELTHPTDASRFVRLVELLWRSTCRALVIRSYEAPASNTTDPGDDSRQALSGALRRVAPDAEIYPVRVDANLSTFVVLRSPEDKHPRDFVAATLDPLILRHPDPLSLITLRLHALHTTRFYPDHAPRLWEYPVVAELITEILPPGSRLIDVGAGVTPLAPFLTSRGYVVDTVDPSPTIRSWPPQPDWNEWDFLDYGSVGLANRSWNCTLDELPRRPPSDGIYSISVIEHVTAAARRSLLGDISARTRPGGLVVLTIDLVRGSRRALESQSRCGGREPRLSRHYSRCCSRVCGPRTRALPTRGSAGLGFLQGRHRATCPPEICDPGNSGLERCRATVDLTGQSRSPSGMGKRVKLLLRLHRPSRGGRRESTPPFSLRPATGYARRGRLSLEGSGWWMA